MSKGKSAVCFGLIVFLLTLGFGLIDNKVSSQKLRFAKTDDGDLAELTVEIASLNTRRRQTENSSESLRIKDSMSALAEKRFEKLSKLIEDNPADVLRFALPEEVLDNLPEELQKYFEKREEIEGELEVVAECEETNGRTLYHLNTGNERLSLHFSKHPEEELLTGSRVRVKGVRVGDAIAADESSSKNESEGLSITEPTALANTTGEIKVLVLLVNFQDDQRQPYTASQANNLMFNNSNGSSVTNYYREASYGQTWVTGDTYGYFTLPMNTGGCDYHAQIASYAKQAATNAGINLAAYDKYMYVFPKMNCTYTGRASIGGKDSWINGSLILRTTAHELGHTLGLYHSKALDCGAEVIGNACTTVEYGHPVDMIGATSMTGHFHPFQKERLGWLNYGNMPPITTVQSSGNYLITGNSIQDTNPKGLRILLSQDSIGRKTWYYVEFRRPFGFDSYISSNSSFMNGVLITRDSEANGSDNYLLDMTPETSSWTDSALLVNRSFSDPSIRLTITPVSVSSSGAVVNVSFGEVPCNLANPTITVNPSATQWLGAGDSVNYSVSITNNNSSNCSANTFNLQTNTPSGWTSSTSLANLYIAPGATVTANLQITSPGGESNGFYSAGVNAVNASSPTYSASAALSLAVYSSLNVSVSTNQTSYTSSQSVVVSSTVRANGSPLAGANVIFTITKPNGATTSGTSTSSSTGAASFSYRFNKKKDPPGTYLVTANADANGISGSGSTSFVLR